MLGGWHGWHSVCVCGLEGGSVAGGRSVCLSPVTVLGSARTTWTTGGCVPAMRNTADSCGHLCVTSLHGTTPFSFARLPGWTCLRL